MIDYIVDIKNLTFKYQAEQPSTTLKELSFHVKRGEWLSIIGHNGSGKSTTVRLIDGLLEADSGTIVIEGDELKPSNVWTIRRKIGMVFQNPDNQFVGATVEDDVAFGLENQGLPREEIEQRVLEALEIVGMTAYRKKEPARLSGGQKQRVALAGVIALRPRLMILDEATSMLDPEGRMELMRTIKGIRKRYDLTVISITHDLDEVALSDRVVVMSEGQVAFSASPRELFDREDLIDLGLDIPFSKYLQNALLARGIALPKNYMTEEELEDCLWQLLSKT